MIEDMRALIIILLLASFIACGERRKFPLEGTWFRGGVSGDHTGYYYLRVREDPSGEVTGTVCRISSIYFIFGDVPIRGHYPYVIFERGNDRFTGGIVSPDQIIGTLVSPNTASRPEWSFQRVPSATFEECLSAPRPPGPPARP
jgi:hypothetical protein